MCRLALDDGEREGLRDCLRFDFLCPEKRGDLPGFLLPEARDAEMERSIRDTARRLLREAGAVGASGDRGAWRHAERFDTDVLSLAPGSPPGLPPAREQVSSALGRPLWVLFDYRDRTRTRLP